MDRVLLLGVEDVFRALSPWFSFWIKLSMHSYLADMEVLTHSPIMYHAAEPSNIMDTMNGLVFVWLKDTASCPSNPAAMATELFKVVMRPNMELKANEL